MCVWVNVVLLTRHENIKSILNAHNLLICHPMIQDFKGKVSSVLNIASNLRLILYFQKLKNIPSICFLFSYLALFGGDKMTLSLSL